MQFKLQENSLVGAMAVTGNVDVDDTWGCDGITEGNGVTGGAEVESKNC